MRFPRQIAAIINNLKIDNYPLLYENEASIGAVLARGLMDEEAIREFGQEAAAASPEERGSLVLSFVGALDELDSVFEIPKTPLEERRAREAFEALTPEERAASTRLWQHVMMSFLAGFYQHLAVVVHGEKLTALVAQAKAGDQTAFAKAVQIDKRILTVIPYFKERHALAGMDSDTKFLNELGRRMGAPPYRGKIRHKSLWLTFSFLDACGLLSSLKHEALLDLCDDVGVGRHRSRIDDVKNLSKRLAEYRQFQRRGIVSTP